MKKTPHDKIEEYRQDQRLAIRLENIEGYSDRLLKYEGFLDAMVALKHISPTEKQYYWMFDTKSIEIY